MASTWQLFKLQEFDSRLDDLQKKIQALESGEALEKEKKHQLEELEKIKNKIKNEQAKIKDKELKFQSISDQKQKVENKLFKGDTTNPKELSAWQEELNLLKNQIDTLETELLEDMDQLDGLKNEQKTKEEQIKNLEQNMAEQEEFLQKELRELNRQIENTQGLREKMASQIEEEILEKYESLRKRKEGLAVVKVNFSKSKTALVGVCGGCFMNLPTPLLDRVKNRRIEFCTHCGRILHPDNE